MFYLLFLRNQENCTDFHKNSVKGIIYVKYNYWYPKFTYKVVLIRMIDLGDLLKSSYPNREVYTLSNVQETSTVFGGLNGNNIDWII